MYAESRIFYYQICQKIVKTLCTIFSGNDIMKDVCLIYFLKEFMLKKYMEGIFENVEIIRRDKGFYVLVGYNGNN